jgi:tRNA A37 threonylcarbamoyladenosine synthetase subunit TsaC/SUA5/YrdC
MDVTTSYKTIIEPSTSNPMILVEANTDNTDYVIVDITNGSGDAAHLEAGGSIWFYPTETSRGLQAKANSGTQTIRAVY